MFSPTHTTSAPFVPTVPAALPWWKRGIDLLCCAIALPFLIVAALVAAVVLGISSPGPIFFRQERIGYRGRPFVLWKFRTMQVGADTGAHRAHVATLFQGDKPMRKLDAAGDRRLVPGGRLLRASGLDELPQVINVLRGEMSIVGPRPCLAYEFNQYAPWQRARCNAVPGLTGLWQVSGKNRTTFNEMIRLDIRYAEERSLALDLGIIARTVPALWTQLRDSRDATPVATPASTASEPVARRTAATFQA